MFAWATRSGMVSHVERRPTIKIIKVKGNNHDDYRMAKDRIFPITFGEKLGCLPPRGAALVVTLSAAGQTGTDALRRDTSSIHVVFDARQPGLSSLSIDSLKQGIFRASPLIDPGAEPLAYKVTTRDGWVEYAAASDPAHPVWEMRCEGDTLEMRSLYRPGGAAHDLTWKFDPHVTHATLLGHVTPAGDIALPAVLHLPGMGSLRVYVSGNHTAALGYVAHRNTNGMTPLDMVHPFSDYVVSPSPRPRPSTGRWSTRSKPQPSFRRSLAWIRQTRASTASGATFWISSSCMRSCMCWPTTPPAIPAPSPSTNMPTWRATRRSW